MAAFLPDAAALSVFVAGLVKFAIDRHRRPRYPVRHRNAPLES
jgi:hypothetical protein